MRLLDGPKFAGGSKETTTGKTHPTLKWPTQFQMVHEKKIKTNLCDKERHKTLFQIGNIFENEIISPKKVKLNQFENLSMIRQPKRPAINIQLCQ